MATHHLTKGDCIGSLLVACLVAAFRAWDLHTSLVAAGLF